VPAGQLAGRSGTGGKGGVAASGGDTQGELPANLPPSVSRVVLSAQEDLRRDIARAMHDGPAQSLTNIVLQAQIVERPVDKDPAYARGGTRLLVSVGPPTPDATRNFIFINPGGKVFDLLITPATSSEIITPFRCIGQSRCVELV